MKWILISALIGSIMLIAYGVSEQYKDKFDFYFNLKQFLNQFKLNLAFKQEKIGEFLKNINPKRQFKAFVEEYQNYLNNGTLNLSKIKLLETDDIPMLENIIKNIGNFDAKNESAQLDTFLLNVETKLLKAEEDKKKLCPMIIKLSLLFSIGLAILLI